MSVVSKKAVTARLAGQKERQVFKHALAKPYTIVWPSAKQKTQEEIVDRLCKALQPIGVYFSAARHASKQIRRLKRRKQRKRIGKKKSGATKGSDPVDSKATGSVPCIEDKIKNNAVAMQGLDMLKFLVLGINSTTRALEKQARRETATGNAGSGDVSSIALVVACKSDIESQVVAHLPALAHAARISFTGVSGSEATDASTEKIDKGATETNRPYHLRLVGVAKGAEKQLSAATYQQRLSVIGIRPGIPELDEIIRYAQENVSSPSIPWIGPNKNKHPSQGSANVADTNDPVLHPMAVHELHTTAPVKTRKELKNRK